MTAIDVHFITTLRLGNDRLLGVITQLQYVREIPSAISYIVPILSLVL